MFVILKIFKFLKIFVFCYLFSFLYLVRRDRIKPYQSPLRCFLLFVFFFASCENEPSQVTPGEAQTTKVIVSRSCPSGSFTISKTVVGSVSSQMQVGDKVTLRGTVNDASPCRQGAVSFTCSARYEVPANRTFICEQGTFSSSALINPGGSYSTTVSTGLPSSVSPAIGVSGIPAVASNAIVSGEVHVWGNGTKSSGSITLPSSSSLVPQATCKIGFTCL